MSLPSLQVFDSGLRVRVGIVDLPAKEAAYLFGPPDPYSAPTKGIPFKKWFYSGLFLFLIAAIAVGGYFLYREVIEPSLGNSLTGISLPNETEFSTEFSTTEESTTEESTTEESTTEESTTEESTTQESTTEESTTQESTTETLLETPYIYSEEELFALCPGDSTGFGLRVNHTSKTVQKFKDTKHDDDYKWVQYDPDTFDRSQAFRLGRSFDRHSIYLGRGIVCGDLVPANVDHNRHMAIVTYHEKTFTIKNFEVFIPIDKTLRKRIKSRKFKRRYPKSALPIGITKRGNKLFAGEPLDSEGNKINFDFPIGKVHPAHRTCYYPTLSSGELEANSYTIYFVEKKSEK